MSTSRAQAAAFVLSRLRWRPDYPRLDALGVMIFLLTLAWVGVSGSLSGGRAEPTMRLLLVIAGYYIGGRIVGSIAPVAIPLLVAGAAIALLIVNPDGVLSTAPLDGPFGYKNATGAFYALSAFAAAMVAVLLPRLRATGLLVAVMFVVLPFTFGSMAAGLTALMLGPLALFARGTGRKAVIAVVASLWLVVLGATIYIGATYSAAERGNLVERMVDDTLSARRPALWHDALGMIGDQPLWGVGPGRFPEVSPVALSDRDARWAHNEFLQIGAETGLLGLLLVIGLIAWAFFRLAARPLAHVTVLGALALGAISIHACIDYVWHFPSVVAAGAALIGSATATSARHRQPHNDATEQRGTE